MIGPQSAITGELLAAFEMFELGEANRQLPGLPQVKDNSTANTGPILPIPQEIRPTLVKYRSRKKINQISISILSRFEVLFWGLRDLKRVQFLTVDKPRVDVECGGHIIQVFCHLVISSIQLLILTELCYS